MKLFHRFCLVPLRRSLRLPSGLLAGAGHRAAAFSLIELMAVMSIITLVAGFTVPAVQGLTGGNTVDAGAAKLGGLLTLARNEAIARHTIVRFVVATGWDGPQADGNLRRVSLWAWQAESGQYLPLTKWEELPVGLVLETGIPDYVAAASYAQNDAATVRGSCVLADSFADQASFPAAAIQGASSTRYIEFTPAGSARIPGSTERQAIFVAAQGYADAGNHITHTAQSKGRPANWTQLNVDTLTGRTHYYRP
jgi:prepilin-type N-terminal cleavage/methylation domain-containing protein